MKQSEFNQKLLKLAAKQQKMLQELTKLVSGKVATAQAAVPAQSLKPTEVLHKNDAQMKELLLAELSPAEKASLAGLNVKQALSLVEVKFAPSASDAAKDAAFTSLQKAAQKLMGSATVKEVL